MFKIEFSVANIAAARAYQDRIDGSILRVTEVDAGREGVGCRVDGKQWFVGVWCSTPERLVQLIQELYLEEYI